MVKRIRIRGHVIRTLGVQPSSSRLPPESCPSCFRFYNDGKYRRCVYLCCEFEDCLDCVINENTFYCEDLFLEEGIPPRCTTAVGHYQSREIVRGGSDWEREREEPTMPFLLPYDDKEGTACTIPKDGSPPLNFPVVSIHMKKNADPTMPFLEPYDGGSPTLSPILEQPIPPTSLRLRNTPSPGPHNNGNAKLNLPSSDGDNPLDKNMSLKANSGNGDFHLVTRLQQLIPSHQWYPVVRVDRYRKRTVSRKEILPWTKGTGHHRKCQTA